MDTLLLKPFDQSVVEINGTCNFSSAADRVMPWSLGVLASILRAEGEQVGLLDAQVAELSNQDIVKHIAKLAPRRVIATVNPVCLRASTSWIAPLREKLDGVNITLLINEPFLDWVALRVPGASVVHGDWVSKLVGRPLPIADYPLPAFDLLPMALYDHQQTMASEGCNHNCHFCHFGRIMGRGWSARPVEHVVEELRILRSYGLKFIRIIDNELALNMDYAKSLLRAIITARLDIFFETNTRVSNLDDEYAGLLAEAGCLYTGYGMECADKRVLDLNNKEISLDQLRHGAALFAKHGIPARAYALVGIHGQSEAEVRATYAFLRDDIQCGDTSFDLVVPFPGTPLHALLKQQNKLNGEVTPAHMAWIQREVYGNTLLEEEERDRPPWDYEHLTFDEALSLEAELRHKAKQPTALNKIFAVLRHGAKGIRFLWGQTAGHPLKSLRKLWT